MTAVAVAVEPAAVMLRAQAAPASAMQAGTTAITIIHAIVI